MNPSKTSTYRRYLYCPGTNLQALIDYTENVINKSSAKISLVISNKPNVKGLGRAKAAGINTMVSGQNNVYD